MKKPTWSLPLVLFLIIPMQRIVGAAPTIRSTKPNVLFILADDLGWSDTTLFGTTRFYQTPNVERLARRGVVFTHAYSASPLCSPTRASIMSGLSPARVGITAPVCHVQQIQLEPTVAKRGPPTQKTLVCQSATRFKTSYYTLAEAMKDAGYATGHFGKWHLGAEPYDPLHQGFDVDVPHWPGPGPAGSYVAPWRFPNFQPRTVHEHIEDRMGDEAVAFMRQHKDEPFFLNYWQFSVHAPFDAKPDYIEKNRKRVDPNDPQRSPTYASMVESLDDNVGKMLDALEELGLMDRTIIIFFSDNGGNMYNEIDGTTPTSNVPLRGGKATMYEGGIRVPCIVSWPGVTKPGTRCDDVIQSVDFYPTILEMLGRSALPGQKFDGISIAAALRGMHLNRDAIFTFFPHAPKVPDWLPPAVSVHEGKWKLIRVFYGRDARHHAYRLYDLQNDIGEKTNLADKYPEVVQELDAHITAFLQDTHAVTPQPNPDYDPKSARLQQFGLSALNDCTIAVTNDGQLDVISTGGDPHFKLELPRPLPAGRFTLDMSVKSTAKGVGCVYWQEKGVQPPFQRQRRTEYQAVHDGHFRDYHVDFETKNPIVSVRIDPADQPGRIVIESLQLRDADDHVVHRWSFALVETKNNSNGNGEAHAPAKN